MAANQLVQARINGQIKQEAAAILGSIGLTVSDAVRMMLTKVVQEKALPFEPLVPNKKTLAAMQEARAGKLKKFDDIQSLMATLNAAD